MATLELGRKTARQRVVVQLAYIQRGVRRIPAWVGAISPFGMVLRNEHILYVFGCYAFRIGAIFWT